MKELYAGADWIEETLGRRCSRLGAQVADLLGDLARGIYHIPTRNLRDVNWTDEHYILMRWPIQELATVDGNLLTVLVVLAHDRMLRVSIRPMSNRSLEFLFHPRHRQGRLYERHPTLEDHVETIRAHYALRITGDDDDEKD